jgi:glyoxylase-like metal-dependent hydrolase (beta-lactamase superfamily II)
MPDSARYSWKLLRAGPLWLDGGGMFGIIPRAVWSRRVPSDEQGRIELAHNCLLLEPVDSRISPSPLQREGRREGLAELTGRNVPEHRDRSTGKPAFTPGRILIETGSGDKFDEKHRRIFGLSDRSIINAVEETGIGCDAISHVIASHLHFDHAGGVTRRSPAGPRPTFPNADLIVHQREWEDALANRSTMTRTYLRENLDPIAEKVRLIQSPPPFPPGRVLQRTEVPETALEARQTEILPGIFAFLTPGHTWGQQAIRFTDDRGRQIVFTPDILPTVHHVGSTYNLAYDVEPYMSTVNRHWFLREAAERMWTLVLDHEPGNPCCMVRPEKEWFVLEPAEI